MNLYLKHVVIYAIKCQKEAFFIEYDYLDINNAMRLVTKWNKGENAFVTIDKWTPYKISFLFEDQVPPNS